MTKTNAMRLLEAAGIAFRPIAYAVDESDLSGESAAGKLGLPPEQVFKTLVLRGERVGVFVCCIPSDGTIDLRKAARAAGDKKAEMLPMKDLLPVTGYIRGGCSPVGMKRRYPLFIDETCVLFDEIAVSAGVRGLMVMLPPQALVDFTDAREAELTQT